MDVLHSIEHARIWLAIFSEREHAIEELIDGETYADGLNQVEDNAFCSANTA